MCPLFFVDASHGVSAGSIDLGPRSELLGKRRVVRRKEGGRRKWLGQGDESQHEIHFPHVDVHHI